LAAAIFDLFANVLDQNAFDVSVHYCLSPFCLPHLYSIPHVHVNTYSILALLLVPGLHVILTRHTLLPPRYVFFCEFPGYVLDIVHARTNQGGV
jgi:hypothetical protein